MLIWTLNFEVNSCQTYVQDYAIIFKYRNIQINIAAI